jgi:hypothetical protein
MAESGYEIQGGEKTVLGKIAPAKVRDKKVMIRKGDHELSVSSKAYNSIFQEQGYELIPGDGAADVSTADAATAAPGSEVPPAAGAEAPAAPAGTKAGKGAAPKAAKPKATKAK